MPTDEEVFALRDEEQRKKESERERAKQLHVWEKGVVSRPKVRDYEGDCDSQAQARDAQQAKLNLVAAATRDRRKEKENMAEFIAKKREMFLVQMSLDTKRAEIRKLEERAHQREEALRKSEQMLEEDALRFDQFLKDNDQKAVQAIKKAEAETKAKAEKVQEIKKLNAQITQIKSDMSKFEEQLEDCRKYKNFLDKLTPPEWFEEQAAKKEMLKEEKRRAKRAVKLKAAVATATEEALRTTKLVIEEENKKKGRRTKREKETDEVAEKERLEAAAAAAAAAVTKAIDNEEEQEDQDDSETGSTEALMYFKEPQQLLDIFTALEESNLFLIQNSQETEEALEELKAKLSETQTRMEGETAGLKSQIDALRGAIRVEEDKRKGLSERAGTSTGVQKQEQTLEELNKKVAEVYRAIFSEADNSLGTLQMLTNIESRLEELLSTIDMMPRDEVEAAEKLKEKERRQRVRELKQAEAAKAQEERIQRSIRRSQEPVRKREGKPIMFRSQPIQRKKKAQEDESDKVDEEDDINFYLQMR
uniref:DUF4200 domain-containing protein n=1 Tax=Chrysotila carterae TaxID=13221 RepID=A0A7S4F2N3_CHRCT